MQRTDYLLDELEELFDRTDEDGDRRIGFDEFKGLMLEMDDPRTESALRAAFTLIDVNHDGNISFDELRHWWKAGHSTPA
jgi:Ca2+-binding EF-hand superfamily protein